MGTAEAKPSIGSGGRFVLKKTADTRWVTRNLLLMKYLKTCPCRRQTEQSSTSLTSWDTERNENDAPTDFFN
jgi:hypothetical protein